MNSEMGMQYGSEMTFQVFHIYMTNITFREGLADCNEGQRCYMGMKWYLTQK